MCGRRCVEEGAAEEHCSREKVRYQAWWGLASVEMTRRGSVHIYRRSAASPGGVVARCSRVGQQEVRSSTEQ